MALVKQTVSIPLGVGLDNKPDERIMDGKLAECIDGEFEEVGGIQTRKPFVAITNHASNTIANIRRLAVYEDELLAFTKGALWSYASGDGLWTQRAEYLAVKVDEESKFINTSSQYDADSATHSGVTMYCWTETTPSGSNSYVAAKDSTTGAVKLTPTALGSSVTRCRLIPTTNKIILSYHISSGELSARAYDPADLSYVSGTNLTTASAEYDIKIHDTATKLVGVSNNSTGYKVFEVSETGNYSAGPSRTTTVTGAVAVGISEASDDEIVVAYDNSGSIKMDGYTFAGATSYTDIALASVTTNCDQITVAFTPADNVFHVFWEDSVLVRVEYNTVDAGAAGTESVVIRKDNIASHAFVHDGVVYIWTIYDRATVNSTLETQLQNTYYLHRSDGFLVAKAVHNTATTPSSVGALPGVQNTSGNSWSLTGGQSRIVALGQGQKGYSASSVRDVNFEFDSDEARRVTQVGATLYIAGSQVMQYDGNSLVEVGFNVFQELNAIDSTVGATLNGFYNWRQSYSWYNAKGELDRSTSVGVDNEEILTSDASITLAHNHLTAKRGAAGEISIEAWRQTLAAAYGAPYYLITSKDPASTGANRYVENDTSDVDGGVGITDAMSDDNLISKEIWPENGGQVLENLPPPPASVIASAQGRVFLAGIPGHPDRMVYSKLRGPYEIVSFHEALSVDLPADGGKITAMAFLNETLIVFKENAIYSLPGQGFDNAGGGANYGPGRLLASDVGATKAETVTLTPKGLVFHSNKGWYLLNRGWFPSYIGGPVESFDSDTFAAVHTMEAQHQVRCCSGSRILAWDYLIDQWSEWSPSDLVHSVLYNSLQHYASDSGTGDDVLAQEANWDNNTTAYGLDVETAWIKMSGLQGFQRVWEIMVLGEYVSAATVRIRVAFDYDDSSWTDDTHWTISPTTANGPMQLMHAPSKQKCQSIKVRITARNTTPDGFPVVEAFKLTGLQLTYGQRRGGFKNLPAAQKQ